MDAVQEQQAVSIPIGEPVHLHAEENTPESARKALLAAIDELFAECQKDEGYCGMNIDVHRFEGPDGKIACIQLVPVDLIGGNPARRI